MGSTSVRSKHGHLGLRNFLDSPLPQVLWLQQLSSEEDYRNGSHAKSPMCPVDDHLNKHRLWENLGKRMRKASTSSLGNSFSFNAFFLLILYPFHSIRLLVFSVHSRMPAIFLSLFHRLLQSWPLLLDLTYLSRILLSVTVTSKWLTNPWKCYQKELVGTRISLPLHTVDVPQTGGQFHCRNWGQGNLERECGARQWEGDHTNISAVLLSVEQALGPLEQKKKLAKK